MGFPRASPEATLAAAGRMPPPSPILQHLKESEVRRLEVYLPTQIGETSENPSGQIIITTSALNGGLIRESSPKSPDHSGLGIILICPDPWKIKRFRLVLGDMILSLQREYII